MSLGIPYLTLNKSLHFNILCYDKVGLCLESEDNAEKLSQKRKFQKVTNFVEFIHSYI